MPGSLKRAARRVLYRGTRRSCPVCGGSFRRFRPAGSPRRPSAACPGCGARERDRFAALLLRARGDLRGRAETGGRAPLRVLHVAPESSVASILRSWPEVEYLSADIRPGRAMVVLDVTRIDRPDDSFDGIWCSHVLEHVADDRAALAEFRRVLVPGGWAVVGVPIAARRTVEDPSVTSPAERKRRFGQRDHVRRYGPNVVERLEAAGFGVETVRPDDLVAPDEASRYGLPGDDQPLFLCRDGSGGR
ncbi:MAG TPA: methyltransferase domain-containing protein [Longimicrobiales bacterium]|nr:methyltransferase domain-containing protein [Longimicrobiales bacterium]